MTATPISPNQRLPNLQSFVPQFRFFDDDEDKYVLIGRGNNHTIIPNEKILAHISDRELGGSTKRVRRLRDDSGRSLKLTAIYTGPSRGRELRTWHCIDPMLPSAHFSKVSGIATKEFLELVKRILREGKSAKAFDVGSTIKPAKRTTEASKVQAKHLASGKARKEHTRSRSVKNRGQQHPERTLHSTDTVGSSGIDIISRDIPFNHATRSPLPEQRFNSDYSDSTDEDELSLPTPGNGTRPRRALRATREAYPKSTSHFRNGSRSGRTAYPKFIEEDAAHKQKARFIRRLHKAHRAYESEVKKLQKQNGCNKSVLSRLLHQTAGAFDDAVASMV